MVTAGNFKTLPGPGFGTPVSQQLVGKPGVGFIANGGFCCYLFVSLFVRHGPFSFQIGFPEKQYPLRFR